MTPTMVANNVVRGYPKSWEIEEPSTPFIPYSNGIDREVLPYLKRFWKIGYESNDSCAGHDSIFNFCGYIGFDGYLDKKKLEEVADHFGLRVVNVEWITTNYDRSIQWTYLWFKSLVYTLEERRQLQLLTVPLGRQGVISGK